MVIGATGEIGKQLIPLLTTLPAISKVTGMVRREVELSTSNLTYQVINFDEMQSISLPQVDVAFCCLGTTIKKAGSQSQFEKVDLDYVVDFAKLVFKNGAKQFHVVSASGANKTSFFFYNRVKGHMEEALKKIPFESTIVYRPSLLDSQRVEKRSGEKIAISLFRILNPLLIGPFKRYTSITTKKVAQGMVDRINHAHTGFQLIRSDEI